MTYPLSPSIAWILKGINAAVLAGFLSVGAAGTAHAQEPPLTELFVLGSTSPMYVQHWHAKASTRIKKGPLVLIHGGSHTGVGWTTTPDGRPGWAQAFAAAGWDAYVVDWPGVGRSGTRPENVSDTPETLLVAFEALLERTGPAVVVGHSIGGALALKLAERIPQRVRAVAAMAPASAESVRSNAVTAPAGIPSGTTREGARDRFANAPLFPIKAFDEYFASLVPYAPGIRNAAVGFTDELKIDQRRRAIWNTRVPVLVVGAEDDMTVPLSRIDETTKAMNVTPIYLGRDWGMPGHGHMFVIERQSEQIVRKVEGWLAKVTAKPTKD